MKLFSNPRPSAWLVLLVFLAGRASQVFANPTGVTVSRGQATLQQLGNQLNITVSQAAILNWKSFNIGAGETTSFLQPSANSIVFNVIGDRNPSQIFGNLNANGTVILANANGFYFGPNSMIKVGGSFIATTAPITPDFGSGATWQFTGMPPLASIINYGQIEVGHGRSLFLISEKIENHGSLTAPGGNIDLVAGQSVLVSESPDGRSLAAEVRLPSGSVDNFGRITADAGTIALQAKVVNQNGVIQADSIQNHNGVIELIASDTVNLGADSQLLTRGDDSVGGSAGGNVTIKSQNIFSDADGSQIVTTGGINGGKGGNVEISAPNIQSLNSSMDAGAKSGFTAGEFLLDPANIILGTSGSDTVPANGTVGSGDNVNGTLTLNVNTVFANKNFSNIKLQATQNITLNASTVWDLSISTGQTAGQLTLQAGGDIIFGSSSKITDANNWSVSLQAGYDFNSQSVIAGGNNFSINGNDVYLGNIYLNGGIGKTLNGTIQTAGGSINLQAGLSILVGSGSVFTTGGGSIFAYALAGDINAGNSNGGTSITSQTSDYNFTGSGYTINTVLGGLSTAAGGNVTLIAGNNIDSTPKIPRAQSPGASGTYGSGDVTVIAGNQITGNYNLANGVGTMIAGVPVSGAQASALQNQAANPSAYSTTLADLVTTVKTSQNVNGNIGTPPVEGTASTPPKPSAAPVTLSLIQGVWNAYAANDISIKEVNNPNGAFNFSQSFLFDYASDAAVNFWAGNAIELIGANLGRLTSENRTPIYAPILSLNAGVGGIKIDNSITLAPSSQGSLSIVTRNGGNLSGAVVSGSTVLNGITMSDSASSDYKKFTSGHDNIHLSDANTQPVFLDVSGNINSFSLTVPTFADITVHGNTYNFGFKGRNLSAAQTTSINVLGAITYRGNLSDIKLTADQLADLLPTRLFTDSSDLSITSKLRYDATTKQLIYVGVMNAADLAFLLNPTVIVRGADGNPVMVVLKNAAGRPILDANGNQQFVVKTQSLVLDATQQGMIKLLYSASLDASLGDQGLALAGPGKFNVNASSIDLGVSGGVRVIAPDAALKAISPYGASLNVTTLGDLSMTSTKIANESYLGALNVNVGGTLDVGGQFTTLGDASAPKGIFSTSGGNVSVVANGDVNVNGSRIAAYNGGNIIVESKNGDINAGNGGAGYVEMTSLELNPRTGQLVSVPGRIPGSGILATTLFGSRAGLGNININAPNGSVNASRGGVIQIAFNGRGSRNSFIEINAGKDINASGSGVIGSNIRLAAGGDINGVIIGSQGISINSQNNVNVTAISGGGVDINASGSVAGTIVGGGNVNVSGDSITAAVMGGTVSASGDTSGASIGLPASNVAKEVTQTTDAETATQSSTKSEEEEDSKHKGISLAQKVSRVTVVLPAGKKVSEVNTKEPKL